MSIESECRTEKLMLNLVSVIDCCCRYVHSSIKCINLGIKKKEEEEVGGQKQQIESEVEKSLKIHSMLLKIYQEMPQLCFVD